MKMKATLILAGMAAGGYGLYCLMKKYDPKLIRNMKKDISDAKECMEDKIENMTK